MPNVLIVVDVQKDFVEGGALAVEGGRKVANNIRDLVYVISQSSETTFVLLTKDYHIDPGEHFSVFPDYVDSWPVHCVAEEDGSKFAEELQIPEELELGFNVFLKGQYSASYSGMDGVNSSGNPLPVVVSLAAPQEISVVGLAYDYCVKATALDFAKSGYRVNVLKDFTASVHPEKDGETTAELEAAGVTVVSSK